MTDGPRRETVIGMKGRTTCPRCGGPLRAPSLFTTSWRCDRHGAVIPVQPIVQPSTPVLEQAVRDARVPVWMPWPLPPGWLCTGLACAGDERTGHRGVAVAVTGPSPLGGPGELVLVAEELSVGLGARYAGIDGPDPGPLRSDAAPHAKIRAAGHPTALWCVNGPPDRAVFIGEGYGLWLWAVLWPGDAGHLMYDDVDLIDLRDAGAELAMVPFGALSPRLLDPLP